MNEFKKVEKNSLIRSALERLSLRTRKKKHKNEKVNHVEIIPKKYEEKPKETEVTSKENEKSVHPETKKTETIMDKETKEPTLKSTMSEDAKPSSSTYFQSRPITQLETALKGFSLATANSRRSLSLSRPCLADSPAAAKLEPVEVLGRTKPCPAPVSLAWKQKPPPANTYLEREWQKLSTSMLSINTVREQRKFGINIDLTEDGDAAKCLDTEREANRDEKVLVEAKRMTKAKSMNVLDMHGLQDKIEVPSNQLMLLNPYQRRVQESMEKLNVSSWYKSPAITSPLTTSPRAPRWGKVESSASSTGWRRHVSHSESRSTTSALPRNSTPLSSQRYRSRFSTLPSSIRSASTSSMNSSSSTNSVPVPRVKVYLGWRSQERLDIGPAYLTSPTQRLASSVVPSDARPVSVIEGTENATEEVLGYEDIHQDDKPPQVKVAWPQIDESDNDSDVMDDDSGIDRSDDFRQEIINEA
jgi:hypothetical protein